MPLPGNWMSLTYRNSVAVIVKPFVDSHGGGHGRTADAV
jgi:hypothetical protein